MVIQKRLDYGYSGYQVPPMPQFPKSAKKKRSVRKKADENQMCPIDLLATIAGKLLSDNENSTLSPYCINETSKDVVKQEAFCTKVPIKTEAFDQQSCNNTVLDPEVIEKQISCGPDEHSQASGATNSGPASLSVKSIISDAIAEDSVILNNGVKIGYPSDATISRCGSTSKSPAFAKAEGEGDGLTRPLDSENQIPGNGLEINAPEMYSLEDPMYLDAKHLALVSSDSSAEVPACRNHFPCNSPLPKPESGIENVVHRDDDDNSSGCSHPSSTITNKACRPQCIGDHGVRKLSMKYRKAAPNMMKYDRVSNYDIETKAVLRSKKICYTRQRTQRSYFKRRRLIERCMISASNRGFFSEDISSLCEKNSIKIEAHDPHRTSLEAKGASPTRIGQSSSYNSVKLSIKSFKVPELFIEIPENATVGSLKRTVMETVTAILKGGLRVGVVLQGKKVRDDSKTLCQVGISSSEKLDSLGFTLEPVPTQTQPPPSLKRSGDPRLLCLDEAVQPLARIPPLDLSIGEASEVTPQPVLTSCPESDHDSVHSRTDASSLDKANANKLALVTVPPISVEALTVAPVPKPRRPEHVQRRIRRPFSVAEVEALVQAVEKLGTGRWRDVKLQAFDSAKHRTYVDLKDKWKTLVHTARISPQQRRGEPVPQELLDRVLSAQAYWSQQQAKLHHIKSSSAAEAETTSCLLL
ncbi:telomere repeat-binding protein 2-like [Canna indica]|uniref:Telomere repeat-binding protein 2-like n=1 Tax=Canna indica TaxID=4628 RepID=A0AAQ3KUB3_9LILI|nr:telomere repeat-binding protein 2-like [Canna indica]